MKTCFYRKILLGLASSILGCALHTTQAQPAIITRLAVPYGGGSLSAVNPALNKIDSTRNRVYALASAGSANYLYIIQDQWVESGVWTETAPLPTGASATVAASLRGLIYVAGGNSTAPLSSLSAYNPISNSWTTCAAMPGARWGMDGAGVISNKLYLAGGWTVSPPLPNNNLWVYDPVANTWDTTRASLPWLSADGACGVINNKLYITTPNNGYSGPENTFLHVYDPSLNTWTQLPSSPIGHASPAFGVIGTKLYVAGGYTGSGVLTAQLDVYDAAANSWSTKAPMARALLGCAGTVLDRKLYVVGGYDGTNSLSVMEVYDPTSDTWTTAAPMITPRNRLCAANLNGVVYAIAGGNAAGGCANTEAYSALGLSIISANDPLMKAPFHLASDGSNLFVSGVGSGSSQYLFQVPATGGAASILYNALSPWEVARVGTNLFWIDPNAGPVTDTEILRAPSDGSGSEAPVYVGSQAGQPIVDGCGLTSDGSVLYASDQVNGSVWRLNPDGSGLTQLGGNRYSGGFSTEHSSAITVYQGLLYLVDSGKLAVSPQVVSIATNGSSFTTLASGAPFVGPSGVAVGNGMIYVSDPGASNTIWQLPLGGGTPTPLISGAPFIHLAGLVFIDGTLYVADAGGDAIYAITFPQPNILAEPSGATAASGGTATLSVSVSGQPPFTYQWQFNGAALPGATNSSLTIAGVSAANAGLYSVTISNAWGSVTSTPASVAAADLKLLASVIVNGLPGLSYTVQSTPALGAAATWTTLTNVTLTTNPYIYVDYGSLTNSRRFYRVVPQP